VSPVGATAQPLKVFISYSRSDLGAASRLRDELEQEGFQVFLDVRDLPYGEEWQKELEDLIRQSDTVLWLVSQASVKSDWCNWELGIVGAINKRLIPIRIRDFSVSDLPKAIGRLHILPAQGIFALAEHLTMLVAALRANQGWLKDATSLADRARQWQGKGRNAGLLLRGEGLRDAELWSRRQPPNAPAPSGEALELILASRQAQGRRQRYWGFGTAALAALMTALAGFALFQRDAAETNRRGAEMALASSDFRQGTQSVEKAENFAEGMALLARAARRTSDPRALARLWSIFQQRALWLPVSEAVPTGSSRQPKAEAAPPADIAERFQSVSVDGQLRKVESLTVSGDGSTVFTATGHLVDGTDVRVRLWDRQGRPKTPWITPEYDGDNYLYAAKGYLSPDGQYLALEVQGWREPSYLLILDVAKNKQFGGRIEVSGLRPESQNVSFSQVSFVKPPVDGNVNDAIKYYLVVGSHKGDASVYALEEGRLFRLRLNQHRDSVLLAAYDPKKDWLVSAASDATLKVASERGAIGQTIALDFPASDFQVMSDQALEITDTRGVRQRFLLLAPGLQRYPATETSNEAQSACVEWPPDKDNETSKEGLDRMQRLGRVTVEFLEERRLRLRPADGSALEPVLFGADIKLICAHNAGAEISVTLDGFRTEVWDRSFRQRLGPPLPEWMLFGSGEVPQKTDQVSLSADGTRALIISSHWIPPNLLLSWASVWDVASGMPLTGRLLFSADGEPYEEAKLASSGGRLLLYTSPAVNNANSVDASTRRPDSALQLEMGSEHNRKIADIAEAVAGMAYDNDGLPKEIPDRIRRIKESVDFLKLTLPEKAGRSVRESVTTKPDQLEAGTSGQGGPDAAIASQHAGGADPKPQPQLSLDARLLEFVEEAFLKDRETYASRVDYYTDGIISREAVLKRKAAYAVRWPQRAYSLIPGSLLVERGANDSSHVLTFKFKYVVSNGQKNTLAGEGTSRVTVRTMNERFEVTSVTEQIKK
jgi:WD40 repeat protein